MGEYTKVCPNTLTYTYGSISLSHPIALLIYRYSIPDTGVYFKSDD